MLCTLICASSSCYASCKVLINQHIDGQLLAAKMFNSKQAYFAVVVCKEAPNPLFNVYYTILHSNKKGKHSSYVPISSLIHVNQPINPNGKTTSTGFLAAEPKAEDLYTVKMRSRLASGEAIDYSHTMELKPGDSSLFVDKGIMVGIARLQTN